MNTKRIDSFITSSHLYRDTMKAILAQIEESSILTHHTDLCIERCLHHMQTCVRRVTDYYSTHKAHNKPLISALDNIRRVYSTKMQEDINSTISYNKRHIDDIYRGSMLSDTMLSDGCLGIFDHSDSILYSGARDRNKKNERIPSDGGFREVEYEEEESKGSKTEDGTRGGYREKKVQVVREKNKRLVYDYLSMNQKVEYTKTIHEIDVQVDSDVGGQVLRKDGTGRRASKIAGVVGGLNDKVYFMVYDDVRLYEYDIGTKSHVEEYLTTNLVTSRGGREVRSVCIDETNDKVMGICLVMSNTYQLDLFINREFVTNFNSSPIDSRLENN